MAQNLVINGISYNGVDSLSIPTSAGGKAEYVDGANYETWTFEMKDGSTVQKKVNVNA